MIVDQSISYHLIVIGGGSAGMAAAIHGAQNGLKVLVFDASGPNFDKPCGEGLMPPAISALCELGVDIPESYRISGIKYITEAQSSATANFSDQSVARGIRRRELRRALWDRARSVGVRVEVSAAESISVSEQAVHVNGIKADYLCIASGANNRVLRQLGLEDRRRASEKPKRIGLRRHVNIKPWSDKVEVYWRDRCELYVTPVADHCVNIAILSFESLDFDSAIDLFPEVKNKIKDATWDDLPRGRGPLSHRSNRVQKGRVLVAGDAALFIDAMTGEGNTLAMRSGIAVAKAIMSGKPILYRWLWLGVVWRYWLVTAPLLWLSGKSRLRNRLLQFVVRYPLVLRIGVRFLSADLSRKRVSDFQYGAQ